MRATNSVGKFGFLKRSKILFLFSVTSGILGFAKVSSADVFTMPSGQTSLQFVNVGSPGNAPDPNAPAWINSSIPYDYSIGEYDVTTAQYAQFLNAVASTSDPYGLASVGNIIQSGSPDAYTYSVAPANQNLPENFVTWGDAARFVNWLDNGQPVGPEGMATTEDGAYDLNGATTNAELTATSRNPNAKYVLPTLGEWYKAAYYDPTTNSYFQYPTSSNTAPVAEAPPGGTNSANYGNVTGGLTDVGAYSNTVSPSGAYDMMGDVSQWTETEQNGNFFRWGGTSYDLADNPDTGVPGSLGDSANPTDSFAKLGFRVVMLSDTSVPLPSSAFLGLGACGLLFTVRRLGNRSGQAI